MRRISIVTPSLNQGRYIRETIESVLAQDDPCFEHIVVDGGSDDDTIEILRSYPHLRWISEPDGGQADAVNKGVGMATGEIVGEINADDYYLGGAFAAVRKAMSRPDAAPVCVGGCDYLRGDEKALTWRAHQVDFEQALRFPVEVVPHPSLFLTRSAWQRVGGMNADIRYGPDVDLIIRLAREYTFDAIDQTLAVNRLHADAIQERDWQRNFTARLYHVARHGSFDLFHEMYQMTHGQFAEGDDTFSALLIAFVREKWDKLSGRSIAVYGAGSHSRWLESITAGMGGPRVVAVLDQSPDPAIRLWNMSPVKPGELDPTQVHAILLSSDVHQSEMAAQCRGIIGNETTIIDLYEGLSPGPYRK